jgi:hypothetical protein
MREIKIVRTVRRAMELNGVVILCVGGCKESCRWVYFNTIILQHCTSSKRCTTGKHSLFPHLLLPIRLVVRMTFALVIGAGTEKPVAVNCVE